MHDLDRIQLEAGGTDLEHEDEYEYDLEGVDPELTEEEEVEELEHAAQLLEVSSEEELEEFLGDLVRDAGKLAGKALRSDTGRALVGVLKDAAKTAIPRASAVLGQAVVPGRTGARFGRAVGHKVTNWLGLELEGLSLEDQEFELARAFVRLAKEACRRAAAAPPSMPPLQVARRAAATAAQRLAPALAPVVSQSSGGGTGSPHTQRRSGRWVRNGDSIIVQDA